MSHCLPGSLFSRLLPRVGQGDGSSDLQHQQHDGTGALHTAGPPLAAHGRKGYPITRTRFFLHTAPTHIPRYTHLQHQFAVCPHSPPLVLRINMWWSSPTSSTLCPFSTPALPKNWAVLSVSHLQQHHTARGRTERVTIPHIGILDRPLNTTFSSIWHGDAGWIIYYLFTGEFGL